MADVYKIIDALLQERGISGYKMSSDLGMSRSFMTELRKGRVKSFKAETAQKIADYFGVSVGYLLGTEPKEKAPTPEDEREIGFDDFTYAFNGEVKDLTESDKQLLLSMARQLNEARKQRNGQKTD